MNIPVLIIAEAGVNHNGDMGLAKRLIDAAAEAGADLVKFQTFKADRLVTAAARKADYQTRNSGGGETQHEMLRSLELSPEAHHELIAHCGARGIGFSPPASTTKASIFWPAWGSTNSRSRPAKSPTFLICAT